MKIILIILILTLIILNGCSIEHKTIDIGKISFCSDFCLSKGMSVDDYTGVQENYINCKCFKIFVYE